MAEGRCKSKNACARAGQLHLPSMVALAILRVRAGICEYRWCSRTIAAKRRVCRRECAAGRSSACTMNLSLCHVSTTLLPFNDARLLVGCVVKPSKWMDVNQKSHIRMQARTARFRPGLFQVIRARVCVRVCVISRTHLPTICNRAHVPSHKASNRCPPARLCTCMSSFICTFTCRLLPLLLCSRWLPNNGFLSFPFLSLLCLTSQLVAMGVPNAVGVMQGMTRQLSVKR